MGCIGFEGGGGASKRSSLPPLGKQGVNQKIRIGAIKPQSPNWESKSASVASPPKFCAPR